LLNVQSQDVVANMEAKKPEPAVIPKDELKKVQAKGEGYRNMDEHKIDLQQLATRYNVSRFLSLDLLDRRTEGG
jgi:hypothetical protein